jgi:CRP/FNR family cyclic AMP-dependent transcriptional regulator
VGESDTVGAQGDDTTGFVVRRAFERDYASGEVIYDVGDPGHGLFVIQGGQVELQREAPDGARTVARYGPGDLFGEMGVLLGRPRTARAVAISDAHLLELDGKTFESMCIERPEIAIRVIQRLATRMIDLEQRLEALGVDDLLRPVVRVLMRRAEAGASGARVPTSLRRLASEAGLSMLEAHRALTQLLERKVVKLLDDVLVVPDLESLAAALD